jgi:hypothetical protein
MSNRFLNSLVQDCITFGLSEKESLEYIKVRYGKPISRASFTRIKSYIVSDRQTDTWLNNFTRIGFVKNHQQDIEVIRTLRDDSMRQLLIETNRQQRDEYKILKLKDNVIETTKLLSELNLGTPIISSIKVKLSEKENGTQTIQTR